MSYGLYRSLIAGLSGFVVGVWLGSIIFLDYFVALFFVVTALLLLLVRAPKLAIIFLIFVGLGVARFHLADSGRASLDNYLGKEVTIAGLVINPPKVGRSQQVVIRPEGELSRAGNILVHLSAYPRYDYGDRVMVTGTLMKPQNFITKSGKEFDYLTYLSRNEIYYLIQGFSPRAELVASGQGSKFLSILYEAQDRFVRALGRVLPESEASLGAGITIGAANSLDDSVSEDFRRAGLSHIIVLSGYNITIVAEIVMKILSGIPRVFGLSAGAVFIVLFTLMTGASSTAVRATVMALVAILARATGRVYQAASALVVAGVLMLIVNPKLLVFDISFQLSFLATLGLIILEPLISPKLKFLTERFGFREMVGTTVSAQIMVTPWLIYKLGSVSIVALPANMLALPIVPLAMMFSAITGLLGLFSFSLAYVSSLPTFLVLRWIVLVGDWFGGLAFASLNWQYLPLVGVVLIYGLILFVVYSTSLVKKDQLSYDENRN